MANRFDHIFNLTEEQAIALLQTPREKLDDGADRYIAASQLAKFPSARTIAALIDAVNNTDDHLDNRIVRRKALESLGRLNAIEALPTIQSCLSDGDCYIVENAMWAIGEIGINEPQATSTTSATSTITINDAVLEEIAKVLNRPQQNYRVAIHTLAKFGYTPAIDRIRPFMESEDNTIKSAAIATLCRLTKDYSQMPSVVELLQHTDLNARRGCIQDLVDTQYYDAIPNIARAPVSVAFRLRGIRLLVDTGLATGNLTFEAIAPYLDQVIRDHPQDIEMVHEYDQMPSLEFLINELYETDLGRCYLATQTLLEAYPKQAAPAILETFKQKAHHDYGGHYHVMKLFGWLKHEPGYDIVLNHGLNNVEPQFQKSRMAGAIALGEFGYENAIPFLKKYFDSSIWSLKYAVLLALEQLEQGENYQIISSDPDPVIALKAQQKRA